MLEGTVSNVPPQGGRKHPEQQYIQVDTSDILFICGGTFSGIENIIRRRIGRKPIGFERSSGGLDPHEKEIGDLLEEVEPSDLLEFGMIPEFIGRLPIACALRPLGEDELVKLLLEPRNALVRQYQALFAMEGAGLEFTDDALREVARAALRKDTGARAVRSVVESFMLEMLYDLPGRARGKQFVVSGDVVRGDAAPAVEDLPRDEAAAARAREEKIRALEAPREDGAGRRESA